MHNPAELIEQASETPHPHEGIHRWIGLTTALLSILIAVCTSQANAIRTEFIAKMVEEDGATVHYQTVSTKYLTLQAQLQHIHALMPDPPVYLATEQELKKLEASKMDEATTHVVKALRLSTKKVLNAVVPTFDDVQRFAKQVRSYRTELDASRKWSESYRPVIHELGMAHARLETAQLLSELAVILASLALMVSIVKKLSRLLWLGGILLGAFGVGILIVSLLIHQRHIHQEEEQIAHAHEIYLTLIQSYDNAERDEALLKGIEADLEKLKIDQ